MPVPLGFQVGCAVFWRFDGVGVVVVAVGGDGVRGVVMRVCDRRRFPVVV